MSASPVTQDYSSHRRYVVGYHFVAATLLAINLLYAVYLLVTDFALSSSVNTAAAVGLVLVFYYAREFSLRTQDRVIRLEEQLRLGRLLPEDLQSNIDLLTMDQLVALRFASDAEIPTLVQKVVSDRITDRDEIKKLIKNWRPDHHRV